MKLKGRVGGSKNGAQGRSHSRVLRHNRLYALCKRNPLKK